MSEALSPFESLKTFAGIIHRQPIFIADRLDVESYHLQFLDDNGQALDDDYPIPHFLSQFSIVLHKISDEQSVLLSMPESWRASLYEKPIPTHNLILDIHGEVDSSAQATAFQFASHAQPSGNTNTTETLLIDMRLYQPEQLQQQIPTWRQHHQHLCATQVNTGDIYTLCKDNSLDLLEGQFYTLPTIDADNPILPSQQVVMELLVKLQDPNIEPEDLADTINQDVSLSYKLLRLINSAFFALPREVSSIKQAVVMLGEKKIKAWASLLCLSGMDEKPAELRIVAMTRARHCELLAKAYDGSSELFFAAGLLSTLDAIIDKPLAELVDKLPLSEDLSDALVHKTGLAGQALTDVLNYEKGDWIELDRSTVATETIVQTYLDAIHWAKELNYQL